MTQKVKEVNRGIRKSCIGTVVSNAPDKTIVVRVDTKSSHKIYKKIITSSKKYYAHDEAGEAAKGDFVKIIETRPLSKLKRWRLVEIIRRAE